MTKQEAIDILLKHQKFHQYEDEIGDCKDEVAKAIDFVVEALSLPSLPSNLEEAAEESYPDFSDSIESKAAVDSMREAFKAGAQWMTGQYKKIEGELIDWYTGDGREYCHGIETRESFTVPEGFYIRKNKHNS